MIVGVVTDGVFFIYNSFEQIGIRCHVFSEAEKTCLCSHAVQLVKDKWRSSGMRAIIEGEIQIFFTAGNLPCKRCKKSLQQKRRTNRIKHDNELGGREHLL